MLILVDRESGKLLGFTLWESEEAMTASEEAAYWFRTYVQLWMICIRAAI